MNLSNRVRVSDLKPLSLTPGMCKSKLWGRLVAGCVACAGLVGPPVGQAGRPVLRLNLPIEAAGLLRKQTQMISDGYL